MSEGFKCQSCGHVFGVKKTLDIHAKTCGAGAKKVVVAGQWVDADKAGGGGGKGGRGKGGKGGGKGGKGSGKAGGGGKGGGKSGKSGSKGGKAAGKSAGKGGGKSAKGSVAGGAGAGASISEMWGVAAPQQRAAAAIPKKAAEAAPVAAGMSKRCERAVRAALQGASGANFVEGPSFVPGQKVLAMYVDEDGEEATEEWFDATVWEVYEDGSVEIYYDDFDDEWATLSPEQLATKEEPEAPPAACGDASTGNGGASSRQHRAPRSTAAHVPEAARANPHKVQREGLPVFAQRERLLEAIEKNQVVVIEGDTGCGKTTQVPQYVLEAASAAGTPCSVICTQPRRISAMGVADRVAAERGESCGGTVGYSIRLESKTSSSTALLFCTTGILTRRLEESPDLAGVTHLFVDEVHERSMESDFLLMVLRDLLGRRPDLRLVLMSATLNADLFAQYFSGGRGTASPVPTVSVPGRAFPVTPVFLEDVLDLTHHRVKPNADWARQERGAGKGGKAGGAPGKDGGGGPAAPGDWTCPACGANVFASKSECFRCGASKSQRPAPGREAPDPKGGGKRQGGPLDADLSPAELRTRYPSCSLEACTALSKLDLDVINFDLVVELLQWLVSNAAACEEGPAAVVKWVEARRSGRSGAPQSVSKGYAPLPSEAAKGQKKGGKGGGEDDDPRHKRKGGGGAKRDAGTVEDAVLVFLPGFKEIQTLHEAVLATKHFGSEPQRSWVLPLHGLLPPEDQRRVFDRPPPGVRKIVIATNIAETAITVDDVSFVIDCGRMKEKRYDPDRRMESLDDCPISRANAKQRRGRAGRTRPGVAFHLITSFAHDKVIESFQPPEISRVPLERLVLTIKALRYAEPAADVCARLLEPPKAAAVRRAVRELVELDALDVQGGGEKLTPLGVHLSTLPVDVRIGKFILFGAIFGMVDETLTIAAALSHRSPFLSPFDKREAADAAKRAFALGQSDHLSVLKAYTEFDQMPGAAKYEFARENFLGVKTLQAIAGLKRQLMELLSDARFVPSGLRARAVEAIGRRSGGNDGVRAALNGGPGGGAEHRWNGEEESATLVSNAPLLKALLCAALYPQVIAVEQEAPPAAGAGGRDGKKGGKGGRGGGGGVPKLKIREEGSAEPVAVMLHPSSVNAKATKFESQFLVYAEKVKTTQVYVRDCAPVSPYALMLFGGVLSGGGRRQRPAPEAEVPEGFAALPAKDGGASAAVRQQASKKAGREDLSGDVVLSVDSWIRFSVPRRTEQLIFDLREQLDGILQHKIENPGSAMSTRGRGVLDAVCELLSSKS